MMLSKLIGNTHQWITSKRRFFRDGMVVGGKVTFVLTISFLSIRQQTKINQN